MDGLTLTSPRVDAAASGPTRLHELLSTGDRAAWATAALALVAGAGGTPELRRSAGEVLDALGISLDSDAVPGIDRAGVAGQAASPLLQTSTLLTRGEVWVDQPDEAIIAQGRASAQGAAAFERLGLPFMGGLAEALATPGARMLDVGTGVAALAASYAELFPELTVVGIDVLPRVLALAEDLLRTSPVADRVILREQDVSGLTDEATYALAWLPAPFVPEAAAAGRGAAPRALPHPGWVADRGTRQARGRPVGRRPHPVQDRQLRRYAARQRAGADAAAGRRSGRRDHGPDPGGCTGHHRGTTYAGSLTAPSVTAQCTMIDVSIPARGTR